MADNKDLINDYYNHYDEENRLVKDKVHNIEFLVSKHYIDRYLTKNAKILEIGAGTGRYSLYYAQQGYDVTAIEYVQHNLEILKSKITPDMKIIAEQGNAVDLSHLQDNTFDVTLVLGPLYHLYQDVDIKAAISEAIRVTKPNGVIMLAYITKDCVFALDADHFGEKNYLDPNYPIQRCPENVFAALYINEFKNLMQQFNVKFLHNVATDGIAYLIKDKINQLTDESFKTWVNYQLSVCERIDCQGYSCHMLYICRK